MLITWNSIGNEALKASLRKASDKEALSKESPAKIPKAMRRRLTPLGCLVIETLYGAVDFLETSSLNSEIPWILSSRHGDGDRVGRLLTDISKKELLSPMDFSQSVHNAIAGAFSIISQNTEMHTALSAGNTSFEMGLLEAYALQKKTNGYVGYAYYTAPMPPPYDDLIQENKGTDPFCLAMILGPKNNRLSQASETVSLTHFSDISDTVEKSDKLLPLEAITLFFSNNKPRLLFSLAGGYFEIKRKTS
ncbi:MAG: beta-ketoacyl synthase chain length factor [Alphaproteobacteria bacterium]|nr:beta-ketoacyl synthase chain length factor [Alphaproteobacteria bacterium]NCQ66129.1 beta-ketoacyl synthase chain length factor [Alphaproteobacteria bacterium]NCT06477.1 beta-ketoacyl synthase chain length factor [Alphaproteobacteria bacterium]